MKKLLVAPFAMGILVLGFVVLASAQGGPPGQGPGGPPPPPPPGPNIERMQHELGLSDTQVSDLKAAFDAEKSVMDGLMKKMDDFHKQLDAATADGKFDEAQVRAIAVQQGQVQADITVEHERMRAKIYSVLTPEQRVKEQEMRQRGPHGPRGPMGPPPPRPPAEQGNSSEN